MGPARAPTLPTISALCWIRIGLGMRKRRGVRMCISHKTRVRRNASNCWRRASRKYCISAVTRLDLLEMGCFRILGPYADLSERCPSSALRHSQGVRQSVGRPVPSRSLEKDFGVRSFMEKGRRSKRLPEGDAVEGTIMVLALNTVRRKHRVLIYPRNARTCRLCRLFYSWARSNRSIVVRIVSAPSTSFPDRFCCAP
jgi:hypothetical protein